ncbi:MAG TPA: Holliday junction branch migration protein RuvA [Patescibacteria group bacterium]
MIGFLSGQPRLLKNSLLIITHGVGYQVYCASHILASAEQQSTLELYIYAHVREEALELYGFESVKDKELFELVLGVSGVGPKTALSIIDRGADRLVDAVQQAQVSFFTAIPRVGKKMAQKVIIELRGKLGELKQLDLGPRSQAHQEIVEAVMALGFAEEAVEDAVRTLDLSTLSVEEAVKQTIKQLST